MTLMMTMTKLFRSFPKRSSDRLPWKRWSQLLRIQLKKQRDSRTYLPKCQTKSISLISLLSITLESVFFRKEVQLSEKDTEALLGGQVINSSYGAEHFTNSRGNNLFYFLQDYPFIFEIVKDAVNLKHTGNLVFTLCMHNQELAEKVSTVITSPNKLDRLRLNSSYGVHFHSTNSLLNCSRSFRY